MKIRIETIDEDAALSLLGNNKDNRKVSDSTVAAYAKDMLDGKWELHGQGISVAKDGTLLDGQHRLWAVIEATKSSKGFKISLPVARDVATTAKDVVDGGLPRTLNERLRRSGTLSAPRKTAILNGVNWLLTRAHRTRLSPASFRAMEAKYAESLDWALGAVPNRIVAPQTAALVLAHHWAEKHRQRVEEFTAKVVNGVGLSEGDPAHTFYRWRAEKSTRGSQEEGALKLLCALKTYCENRKILKLYATWEHVAFFTAKEE